MKTPTEVWAEFQKGVDYKSSIDLFETVRVNENMFLGRQWEGVNAPDLPKPVLNIMKRVVSYKIAMIVSDDVGISFTPHISTPENDVISKLLAREVERVIEQSKIKTMHRELLRDAAVCGDCCVYQYFDPEIETGQDAKGDIRAEVIDNINVMFGNPYSAEVQRQPYIIIAQRRTVAEVKGEAKRNGVSDSDREQITADSDTNQGEEGDSGLCTLLVRLWKEKGTIRAMKSTEKVIVQKEVDLGYKLYPIAWMPWEKVRSSCHGQADITGLVPNQISINRLFAMTIRSVELNAFPKIIYDSSRIKKWSNKVGEAIGVEGGIETALAQPIRGGDVSGQVMQVIESVISMTRDFMGASDAALGNVKPDNTSAIIAVQQAAAVPLELVRRAFWQFVEDYVRISVDIIRTDYGKRMVSTDDMDIMQTMAPNMPMYTTIIDFSEINEPNYALNVDVGAASYWSEITQIQTLDALFKAGVITDAVTYLESLPDHVLRNKDKLIEKIKQQQEMQQQQMMQQIPNTPPGV